MIQGLIQIHVFGEPRPFPKKEALASGDYRKTGKIIFAAKDYRERRNPITGKTDRYDKGYKARWMQLVTDTVDKFMFERNLEPFPKNHPIAMGCLFFITKSPSCKLLYPSQDPDDDNFLYAVRNALKRTPKKKGKEGMYPKGVLYYEDNQIVWILKPGGVLWATEQQPPGVLITVQDALELRDEIERYQPSGQVSFA